MHTVWATVLGSHPCEFKWSKECRTIFRISNYTTRLAMYDWTRLRLPPSTVCIPELIVKVYSRKSQMDDIFDLITCSTSMFQVWSCWGMKGKAYGNLHVVDHRPGQAFIITHAHLAGVRDMVSAWFNVLSYSHLHSSKYPGFDMYAEISNCIQLGAKPILWKCTI